LRIDGGKTRDFNLMVRKGPKPSRMLRVEGRFSETLHAGKRPSPCMHMPRRLQCCLMKRVLQLAPASLAWRTVTGSAAVRVAAQQALWMEIPA
jgi:hypothetical protein